MEKHKAKPMSNLSKNFKMPPTNAHSDAKPTVIFLKIKMHEKFIHICMIFSWKICTGADEAAKNIVFSYTKMMFFGHCFENDDFRHMFLHGPKINITVFIKPTLRWPCKKLWRKCEIFNKKNSWQFFPRSFHAFSTVIWQKNHILAGVHFHTFVCIFCLTFGTLFLHFEFAPKFYKNNS